jgi:hypothetical protein
MTINCSPPVLRFLFSLLCAVAFINVNAQMAPSIREDGAVAQILINEIFITGNKKTKPQIILRELGFAKGTSVLPESIGGVLVKAKQQLINTSLFLSVAITKEYITDTSVSIYIIVKERWYIFPAPVFSLADRNLNLWWNQQRRSFKRVNYGLAMVYKNLTGHNDNLDIGFQTGYNPS